MAKTYRRGTTVNRRGRTHYRRGGAVRYQPAAGGGDGILAVFRAAAVGISRPVLKAVHKVSDLPGRKARLERDKALTALMSERLSLRTRLAEIQDEEERLRVRRRIWQLDQAWRAQDPNALPPAEEVDKINLSPTKGRIMKLADWLEETEESLQDELENMGELHLAITDDYVAADFVHADTGQVFTTGAHTTHEALAKIASEVFTD